MRRERSDSAFHFANSCFGSSSCIVYPHNLHRGVNLQGAEESSTLNTTPSHAPSQWGHGAIWSRLSMISANTACVISAIVRFSIHANFADFGRCFNLDSVRLESG